MDIQDLSGTFFDTSCHCLEDWSDEIQEAGDRQKKGLGTALLRAAAEFGDAVEFEGISTEDRAVFRDWGIADGLFVDGRPVRTGPPPSFYKIRRKIARRAKRAKGRGPDRICPA